MLYAFGTPGCSYEYNNLHAIRVALMILKSSKDRFKRKTGVGIATGNICTGIIGKLNFRCKLQSILHGVHLHALFLLRDTMAGSTVSPTD